MARGTHKSLIDNAASDRSGRGLLRSLVGRRNRPEPFKPYDPQEHRPRWGPWVVAGTTAVIIAVVVVTMNADPAHSPRSSVPMLAASEVLSSPDRAATGADPAYDYRPVQSIALQPQPAVSPTPEPREAFTTVGANMRSAPTTAGTVVWTAPRGTRLRIAGEEGSWLRVATPNGERTGWMHRSLVAE